MKNSQNVLVVAAHPDDEVLGCGGTIARLVREGCSVSIAILGEGITSRFASREEAKPEAILNLRECSRRAAEVLGVNDLHLFDLPDNRFDTVPLLDIVKKVEQVIELPLAELTNPANYGAHEVSRGSLRFRAPHIAFGPHRIWGATAIMLGELIALLEYL